MAQYGFERVGGATSNDKAVLHERAVRGGAL